MGEVVFGLREEVAQYVDLLDSFVAGQISALDFETGYFERYKASTLMTSDDVFRIADGFFADVDAYVDDPTLREPSKGDLGAEQLRERALELLHKAGYR